MRWEQHPPSFYCPISQQCMHDPVVLADGHTYECRYIERWLEDWVRGNIPWSFLTKENPWCFGCFRPFFSDFLGFFWEGARFPRKNIRCGQGGQLWQKTRFWDSGRTNFARKTRKKRCWTQSARSSQEHIWDSQMVCTHRAQISHKKKNGMWDSKCISFPATQEIGTERVQFLEKN